MCSARSRLRRKQRDDMDSQFVVAINRKLHGKEYFVSRANLNESIIYSRVARARPYLEDLQLADDNVDWDMEYYCEMLGKRITAFLERIMNGIRKCCKFIGYHQRALETDEKEKVELTKDKSGGDFAKPDIYLNSQFAGHRKPKEREVWTFKNCSPYFKRRFIKRKYFMNPATRQWAKDATKKMQVQALAGFNALYNRKETDLKIYVSCWAHEVDGSPPPETNWFPKTFVYNVDSKRMEGTYLIFCWISSQDPRQVKNGYSLPLTYFTPRQMEAILVYLYTKTWPKSWMTRKEGTKRFALDPEFKRILAESNISLYLPGTKPPKELLQGKTHDVDTPTEVNGNNNDQSSTGVRTANSEKMTNFLDNVLQAHGAQASFDTYCNDEIDLAESDLSHDCSRVPSELNVTAREIKLD